MQADQAPRRRTRPKSARLPLAVETVVTHGNTQDVLAYARVAAGVLARMAQRSSTASQQAA